MWQIVLFLLHLIHKTRAIAAQPRKEWQCSGQIKSKYCTTLGAANAYKVGGFRLQNLHNMNNLIYFMVKW